jgi:hypothetical protein
MTRWLLLLCFCTQACFADEVQPEPVHVGPKKPTAPHAIKQPEVIDSFRCERRFRYKGKLLECDSNVQRDAERLRPVMEDVPAALAELDTYQRSRQNVRTAAYVGSVGLLVALGGVLLSRSFTDSNGNLTNTGLQVRTVSLIGGLGITGISFGFGWITLHKTESYIDNAVRLHNQAHPDTPIELQFTTGFSL